MEAVFWVVGAVLRGQRGLETTYCYQHETSASKELNLPASSWQDLQKHQVSPEWYFLVSQEEPTSSIESSR